MTTQNDARPHRGTGTQTAGEHVTDTVTPDADYVARLWVGSDLTDRQRGLLRAMIGAGPCVYFNDASCLTCSGATLAQMLAAVRLHGPVLRRYAADVEAIRGALQATATAWARGQLDG